MKPFLRLIRWPNLVMVVLTQYLTRVFLVGNPSDWQHFILEPQLILIVVSTVLIAAAGYIINDYFDVKIDLINKPDRVVVGRYLPRRHAMLLHQSLSVAGVMLGLLVSKWVFLFNGFCITLLWLYSERLKRQPFIGNFVVALLSALTLLVFVVCHPNNPELIGTYAIFAFFITLIREIIKDMEDLKGDATHGCKTLPILWGVRPTKGFVYVLIALLGASVCIMARWLGSMYLGVVVGAVMLPALGWLTYQLARADTKHDFGRLSAFCKIIMLVGILTMVGV